ncbi:MAG: tetratricopeptide repeat protein [Treponema sp.]|jgi:tetratricopeptide (TPR) repeat protein|nr:tetratricopeptide repeat protein [Treponema sp.]
MPSLQALAEFKTSFRTTGNEAVSLAERNLPAEDLALPDAEPESPPVSPADTGGEGEVSDGTGAPEPAGLPGLDDFDLGDLLGTAMEGGLDALPDFDEPYANNEGEVPAPDISDSAAALPEEGAGFPESSLDGLAGEFEPGFPPEDAGDAVDFGGLADDLSEEAPEASPGGEDGAGEPLNLEDFDLPEFNIAEDIPLGDTISGRGAEESRDDGGALDAGPEPDALEPDAGETLPDLDFSPGLDIPPLETEPEEEPQSLEELLPLSEGDGAEQPGDAAEGEGFSEDDFSFPAEEISLPRTDDAFDNFDPAGGSLKEKGSSPETARTDLGGLEDFSLAGIDDVLEKAIGSGPKKPAPRARGAADELPSDEVEEIQLTDQELVQLQQTLASYPLNLRIACEELIAEEAVLPDLMSRLIKLLVRGGSTREAAALAGKILGRTITIPRGLEKRTGEDLEREQGSFSYIFVHKFLPILRLFLIAATLGVSLLYLIHQFIYTPLKAESIYRRGYERIFAGEYARANDRFHEALRLHRKKNWFYRYAEAFRDARQYVYAEEKYDELLRYYPRDKKGVLDYADMETNYLRNYAKADSLLRRNILDYNADDPEGLLALGDNSLAWGELEPEKYEDARAAYARLLARYGWTDPVVERMLKYFIRTDNLEEVLPLQAYFMNNPKRKISPPSLAELGGYLLDKRIEEPRGLPNPYIEQIEGIRAVLLRAAGADPALPESYYHLARYYDYFSNGDDERITLESAIRAFDAAPEGPVKRVRYRIDAERRYAQVLINGREFFAAEEQLIKGIGIYEDAVARRLFSRSPEFGKLYADLGDLEYFTQEGNMELALENYLRAERNGWAPPEIQYRMGSVYYHRQRWDAALERFFAVSGDMPLNRRLLYALGNVSYMRGNYFAAQGYYNRLLDLLGAERARFSLLQPNEQGGHAELAERLMAANNNLGVTMEALTEQTGDNRYRSRALGFYTESARAWDALTRNPETMLRFGAADISTPGINLAYLNSRNILYPDQAYDPQLYLQIDKDAAEPSPWEHLVPLSNTRLSSDLSAYR